MPIKIKYLALAVLGLPLLFASSINRAEAAPAASLFSNIPFEVSAQSESVVPVQYGYGRREARERERARRERRRARRYYRDSRH